MTIQPSKPNLYFYNVVSFEFASIHICKERVAI